MINTLGETVFRISTENKYYNILATDNTKNFNQQYKLLMNKENKVFKYMARGGGDNLKIQTAKVIKKKIIPSYAYVALGRAV